MTTRSGIAMGNASPGAQLSVEQVARIFRSPRGRGQIEALKPIDLAVERNDFITILGPSGCGKSTLLRIVAGLDTPTAGRVLLDGRPIVRPGPDRGMVFQSYTLFPWLTVKDNVKFGLRLKGLPAARQEEIAQRLIGRMGLTGFEAAYSSQLSGGMKQRVEYARALAVDPDVLYLDEPFGALDALTRLEMRREIARIRRATGKTCLLVTHDVEEACELADRIAVMTPRPAKIREVFDNVLPHPRDPDGEGLRALRVRIFAAMGVDRRV